MSKSKRLKKAVLVLSSLFMATACSEKSKQDDAEQRVQASIVVEHSDVTASNNSPDVKALNDMFRTDSRVVLKAGEISAGSNLVEYVPLQVINNEAKKLNGIEVYYREENGDEVLSKKVGNFKISLMPGETTNLKVYHDYVVKHYRPVEYATGEFHEPPFKCTKAYYADGSVKKFGMGSYFRTPKSRD